MGSTASIQSRTTYEKQAIEMVNAQIKAPTIPYSKSETPFKRKQIPLTKKHTIPEIEHLEPHVLTQEEPARVAEESYQDADTGRFCTLDIEDRIKLQYNERQVWERLAGDSEM